MRGRPRSGPARPRSLDKRVERLEEQRTEVFTPGAHGAPSRLPVPRALGRRPPRGAGPGRPLRRPGRSCDDVDFHAGRGDRIVVVGRNGAGKSSLLRCLAGVQVPTAGEVTLGANVDRRLLRPGARAGRPDASAPSTNFDDIGAHDRGRAAGAARVVRPARVQGGRQMPASLSGGERAKLGLAMLAAGQSNLLDPRRADQQPRPGVVEAVGAMLSRWPGTMVAVSHDRAFVEALEPTHALQPARGALRLLARRVPRRVSRPLSGTGRPPRPAPARVPVAHGGPRSVRRVAEWTTARDPWPWWAGASGPRLQLRRRAAGRLGGRRGARPAHRRRLRAPREGRHGRGRLVRGRSGAGWRASWSSAGPTPRTTGRPTWSGGPASSTWAGGSPMHLRSVLKGSAVLAALREAWRGGAVVAGSSAGAMVLTDPMVDPRGGALTVGLGPGRPAGRGPALRRPTRTPRREAPPLGGPGPAGPARWWASPSAPPSSGIPTARGARPARARSRSS